MRILRIREIEMLAIVSQKTCVLSRYWNHSQIQIQYEEMDTEDQDKVPVLREIKKSIEESEIERDL